MTTPPPWGTSYLAKMGGNILYSLGERGGGTPDDRALGVGGNKHGGGGGPPRADRAVRDGGGKEMLLVDNVENREFLRKLIEVQGAAGPEKERKRVRCAP